MPCYTVQNSSINLELKAENQSFLVAGLKSIGYTVIEVTGGVRFFGHGIAGTFDNGKLNINGPKREVDRFNANTIKVAYSQQVVKAAATKYGWKLKQKSATKFGVQKAGL